MSVSASALRELHRIHRQVTDLRSRLERGPKQIRGGEGVVKHLEQEVEQAKQALTRTRVAADEKQLQLKQREDRIKGLQLKLNECSSNREYQALKEQIAADEQANSVLADEILDRLEKIDELAAAVAVAQARCKTAQADLEQVRKRVQAEHDTLESELARVTAELAEAEKVLPAEYKADYQRIAKVRGEDTLAPVEGETCGGCYTTLSPQTMNELYMSKLVTCKSCGCLLYLPEDRSVGGRSG